ncbi:MAG: PilN domain-containing protein [Gemmatimonadetes bacterium]|nr:PilN domain-containing protein [Gemmatimonadota bacterium]
MIEINLLPGSGKRQKKKLPVFRMGALPRPQLPALRGPGTWVAVAWLIGLGALAWLHFSSTGALKQARADVSAAERDSVRLARLRILNDSLQKQITEVGARLQVLQEIDAGRYTWAHVFDEISRALPQYTWLLSIQEVESTTPGAPPRIRIIGRTGNTFALARFMQDLEASPFLQRVSIISQSEVIENEKSLYAFTIEVDYEEPPPDAIEMRPLFEGGQLPLSDSAQTPAAPGEED